MIREARVSRFRSCGLRGSVEAPIWMAVDVCSDTTDVQRGSCRLTDFYAAVGRGDGDGAKRECRLSQQTVRRARVAAVCFFLNSPNP